MSAMIQPSNGTTFGNFRCLMHPRSALTQLHADRPIQRGKSGRNAVEAGFEFAFAAQSHDLLSHLPLMKEKQRRNGMHAILRRQPLIVLDVDLADLHPAAVFLGEFIQNRAKCLAGTTPFGPEINHDGRGGINHFGFKIILRQSYNVRSCHNREEFAGGATNECLRRMLNEA